jgi:hypothetical protein
MKIYKNKGMFRLCLFMFHTFYLVAMCVHFNTMNNILLETSQPVSIFALIRYILLGSRMLRWMMFEMVFRDVAVFR